MQAIEPFGQKEARKAETSELQYLAKKIRMRNPAMDINHILLSFFLADFSSSTFSSLQAIPRVRLSRTSLPEDGFDEDKNKDDARDDVQVTDMQHSYMHLHALTKYPVRVYAFQNRLNQWANIL